jgi:hypothetical protein
MSSDTRSHTIDDVCAALKVELGESAPPRSTVEACMRLYDEQRRKRESPPLEHAPASIVLPILAETTLAFELPGGGSGSIDRLGDTAAFGIMTRLDNAGVKLMRPVSSSR